MLCDCLKPHDAGASRRILVVDSGRMLDECLSSLLSSQAGFDISTVSPSSEAELTRDVLQSHPDVVVLSQSESLAPRRLIERLRGIPDLAGLKLIVAHVNDDTLDVYACSGVNVADGAEFIAVARGDSYPME